MTLVSNLLVALLFGMLVSWILGQMRAPVAITTLAGLIVGILVFMSGTGSKMLL